MSKFEDTLEAIEILRSRQIAPYVYPIAHCKYCGSETQVGAMCICSGAIHTNADYQAEQLAAAKTITHTVTQRFLIAAKENKFSEAQTLGLFLP